jgi:plastocyanin
MALAAALLVLVTAACGGGDKKKGDEASSTTTIEGQAAADFGTEDVSGKSEIELEADDNYFKPTLLKGKPGQKLTLEIKNEGKAEHNFSIDSMNIDQDLEAGEDARVEVTLPQSGSAAFYCKYHKAQAMAGGLTVRG